MSERTTGATDDQIEAGARRYFAVYENTDPDAYREWERVGRRERAIYAEIAEEVLRGACPPDHRIVAVDDPALRERIARALSRFASDAVEDHAVSTEAYTLLLTHAGRMADAVLAAIVAVADADARTDRPDLTKCGGPGRNRRLIR